MKKMIYLDNAATTPTAPEVIEAMLPFYERRYGNPSALYDLGQKSHDAIEESRKIIAQSIGAQPEEIYFTAGGSESDNWALKCTAESMVMRGRHIITTKIEHHAILRTCGYLEQNGYEITYLPVDDKGTVSLEQVRRAIRPDTILISVMMANNEIGTIEPIARIGMLARRYGICFHTDAVQAYGHIPIDVNRMNIDMMSASAHKFNGPKGTGFLYVRKKKRIPPFIHGGGQESGVRAGTENVPGIVGMGKAAAMAMESLKERMEIETRMRDYLIYSVLKQVPKVRLNGEWNNRLPNNVDFCFDELEGGNLLVMLDMDGICASAGSACSSVEHEPSHVLTAIGVPPEIARGALRLTLNEKITAEQIDYVTACIKKNVTILRGQKETVKFT
ncbi:MAG: cysteine desulfurase family protein [Roseburia sp.]